MTKGETYIGNIQLVRIREHKDGSATFEIAYDVTFANTLKRYLGIKRLTKARVKKIVKAGLLNLIKTEETSKDV